ncbi:MAG: PorV/PorQ family protein [Elusimicrobia bacterium]|nr:PorV/PorQ family protein [Elusimicrobiota bacterium]
MSRLKPGPTMLLALVPAFWAPSARAYSGADFLNVEPGARPGGMSGAFTAVADDANAVRWNPAGMRQLHRAEASFAQRSFFGDLRLYDANFVRHFGQRWSGGVGVSLLDYGEIEQVNNQGEGSGNYGARDMLLSFAGARDIGLEAVPGRVRLGGGARVVRREIERESATGWTVDAAGHWELERWRVGATLQNLGPPVGFGQESEDLPMTFRVGGAFEPTRRLLLSADAVQRHEGAPSFRLGGEITAARVQWTDLVLRTGFSTTEGVEHGMSAGIGIIGLNWEFAYSWKALGDLAFGHWVGFTYRFRVAPAPRLSPEERSQKKAEGMYDRLMRWYEAQKDAGRLSRSWAISILERIIARYEPLGVDVSRARSELGRVKAGEPLGRRRAPEAPAEDPSAGDPLPSLEPLLEAP